MKLSTRANFYLVCVTIAWGATFPLIRNAVLLICPSEFVLLRFSLATLVLLPFVWRYLKQTNKNLVVGGLILGLLNSGTYIFQTIGLKTVHSSEAAFITGMNVVIVPFLLPFFRLGKPTSIEIISSLTCLVGLFILTGANINHVSAGQLWILLCALFVALQIAYLQRISAQIDNYILLAFYQILFIVPVTLLFSVHTHYATFMNIDVIVAVVFCAVIATSLAIYLQTKYQKHTTPTKAALIFALEPVFAGIFGYLINNEAITLHIAIGGAVILVSLLAPELLRLLKRKLK